jgi:ABC-type bacteriocin/lantibiotic exporter with double-glycine peptidase domain
MINTPFKRLLRMLELDRQDIIYVYVYAVLAGIITLSLPLGIQAIIGLIAGGSISSALFILLGVVTLGVALTGILKIMQLSVVEVILQRIFLRSALDFSFRLPRFKLEGLTQKYPPELMNRFFDTLTLQKGIPKILIDFSSASLQILIGLLLISFYHPFFVFFSFILIVILFLIFRFTGPIGLKTSLMESKYKYAVAHWLEEIARSMYDFKITANRANPLITTDKLASKYVDNRKAHFKILITQYSTIVIFETILTATLLTLGAYLVIENQINIGQFVAAEIIVILVIASVEKLILTMESVYDVLTAIEKMGEIMDLPLEREDGELLYFPPNQMGISLEGRDLSFSYEPDAAPSLQSVNFKINAGEKICLAGDANAGKTTLLHILSMLYTDVKGQLLFNEMPVGSLNINSIRCKVGHFLADENIQDGTILDNICMGNKDFNFDKITPVADAIGLTEIIQKMPKGYLTHLVSEGRNISKSTKSKIILARSLIFNPALWLAEGDFMFLNRRERHKVSNFILDYLREKTVVISTNDPIIAEKCDRIILIKSGTFYASGTLKALENDPYFQEIFY